MEGKRIAGEEPEAGPYLDRLIELRVFGRKPTAQVPPYSTDEGAAELVIVRLHRPPLRWMSLQDGDDWTFHWRKPFGVSNAGETRASRYVQMVTAKATTRPLAICRAALKLLGSLSARSPGEP